ncbi:unnamed protein product [Adineta steineri]|uniref:Uncharacterized protein n=1 Tax=Adineta steineri TaxID=433720 RepID=A0A816FE53_9BILA|nr:unnamed protein product [Adineta steineri]CAF1660372.1 unnamed protein product [Adineta steineri]
MDPTGKKPSILSSIRTKRLISALIPLSFTSSTATATNADISSSTAPTVRLRLGGKHKTPLPSIQSSTSTTSCFSSSTTMIDDEVIDLENFLVSRLDTDSQKSTVSFFPAL